MANQRPGLPLFLALLGTTAMLTAQAPDYAGISVSSTGVSPLNNRVSSYPPCGTPFTCTPMTLTGQAGDSVSFFVMGTMNGVCVLLGSIDTTPNCIPLGIPGLVNNLVWLPGPGLITLFVGVCTVPDNGRCNGGATPTTQLFQIPAGLTGSIGLQAIANAPLSGGGTGLAFSNAVQLNF
ncbi:MAG: hypothetical protein IPK26_19950 [Planctomycetes bacterium]|nr:hypothetical protein [Planctomycetota bacterium]